ncbi:MAG: hypothetical protein HYZ26_07030 [Chloroflexi bacterium]|nr:hypothetical protein [Chloroflexota bacterium]
MSRRNWEGEATRQLLVRGIASARARETSSARYYLEKVIDRASDPSQQAEAYFWLSQIEPDPKRKRDLIEHILALYPAEPRARRELAILDGKIVAEEMVNPDQFPKNNQKINAAATGSRHECPNCGAALVFTTSGRARTCENCGHSEGDLAPQPAPNRDLEQQFISSIYTARGHSKPQIRQVFECRACGAQFLLEPQVLSFTCPHCDSAYSIQGLENKEVIAPSGMLDPQIGGKSAESKIVEWWHGHGLLNAGGLERMTGIYLPVWTFDIGGYATWSAEIYQNQEWGPMSGNTLADFDDVFIPASRQNQAGFESNLESLRAVPIQPPDLDKTAGWLAETYTVALSNAAISARAKVLQAIRRKLDYEIIGEYRLLRVSTLNLIVESYKLVLVPWWLSHYAMNGERYAVSVNACTGDVLGELPPTRLQRFARRLFGR